MKCINCKHSKKSRSKVYAGYCTKHGVHWKDEMNGCMEGLPKAEKTSRIRYAKLYRELMAELRANAMAEYAAARRGCGMGTPGWERNNAVAVSINRIVFNAEEREAAEGQRA